MRILVTGGGGFIGGHLTALLRSHGHDARPLDINPEATEAEPSFYADVREAADLATIFEDWRPDAVAHLAAQSSIARSWENPVEDASKNILGTIALLQACEAYNVGHLVFTSTAAVYAPTDAFRFHEVSALRPITPYGLSKLTAEAYIKASTKTSWLILRLANVYGRGQVPIGESLLIPRALAHIYQGQPFEVFGNGLQERDFVHVEDVCRAIEIALVEHGALAYDTFNIGTGKGTSVMWVLEELQSMSGRRDLQWIHGKPRPGDLLRVVLAPNRANLRLGWEAKVSLEDGLAEALALWPKSPSA
jgi:UDP-glucose 4-epimerase